MNKKQFIFTWLKKMFALIKDNRMLIIFWSMGIAICSTFLLYPKKYFIGYGDSKFFLDYPRDRTLPVIQWSYVIPICLSILIIGGLLIYTLRDKKK